MRFLLPSLVLAFAVGCGGSVTEAPAVDEDSGATPGDDSSSSGGDSSTPSDDGSTPGDDALVPPDDAPVADGSVPPTDGGKPAGGTITCGMTTCDAKTQECCVSFSAGGTTSKCVATGMCMGMGSIPLTCTDPGACAAGEVCCARIGGGGMSGASCSKTCMGGTRLCAADSDCRMGEKCQLSMFTGLKSCRATGGGGFDAGAFDVGGFPKPDTGAGG